MTKNSDDWPKVNKQLQTYTFSNSILDNLDEQIWAKSIWAKSTTEEVNEPYVPPYFQLGISEGLAAVLGYKVLKNLTGYYFNGVYVNQETGNPTKFEGWELMDVDTENGLTFEDKLDDDIIVVKWHKIRALYIP